LATLGVALSLALFALGDADPAGGFCLRTLNFGRHMLCMGTVLDMIAVATTMCNELGRPVNVGLLCFVRAHFFTSSVVTNVFTKGKRPFIHKWGYHTQGYIKVYMPFVQVVKMEPTYQKQNGHENLVLMPWFTSEVTTYQATC
jgi:hypothetical protein